eukprot:SAG22_NODE_6804_length_809_cov_1.377465_1_plen_90_part_10
MRSVRLADCDHNGVNADQHFIYDPESRSVSNQGGCLLLPMDPVTLLPDPTMFTSVKLGSCPPGAAGAAAAAGAGQLELGDSKDTNSFTWS